MRIGQFLWHSFVPDLIDRNGVAFDLGANHGEFSEYLADHCRIVLAVEPNPAIPLSDLKANVQLRRCAVGWPGGDGRLRRTETDVFSGLIRGGAGSDSGLEDVDSIRVGVVTLADLCSFYDGSVISFVKMDIEGAELDVLSNERGEVLCNIKQLTVEFHDFLEPASLPRIKQVIERMEGLGFCALRFSFSTFGDVLFLNRRYVEVGAIRKAWWLFRFKMCRGANRRLRRLLRLQDDLPPGYALLQ
jgi:FkbM family methyltransferase